MAKKIDFKKIGMRFGGGAVAGAASFGVEALVPATVNPWFKAVGKLVVGAVIPEFAPKNDFLSATGAGFIACGTEQVGSILMAPATSGVGNHSKDEDYVVDVET
ncbi:MAG: hypothetical protein ACXVNR_07595, partial [Bacteroidia bacterium]